MGIVERAAARLVAVGKPDAGGPAAREGRSDAAAEPNGAGATSRGPDLIERAAAGGSGHADVAHAGGAVPDTAIPVPVAPSGAANPLTLEIDFDWLRRKSMITPEMERTEIAEGFRRIKRHILANASRAAGKSEGPMNLVMVTSALPGEGKTFCAVNLAISLAMELDRRVLLVDADTVRPSVLPALGLPRGLPGLMDVLADRRTELADVLHPTNIPKLAILPAGTPHRHGTEMLASDTMRALVRELAERYDDRIVVFDSPPLLLASEAAVLAAHMSQVVVVAAAWQTAESALRHALKHLEGCRRVGLLLNKGQSGGAGYGYGYGYGYG